MDDDALWALARGRRDPAAMARYDELLARNSEAELTGTEKAELQSLRLDAETFMLRKAHAAALLRWRGHPLPAP